MTLNKVVDMTVALPAPSPQKTPQAEEAAPPSPPSPPSPNLDILKALIQQQQPAPPPP